MKKISFYNTSRYILLTILIGSIFFQFFHISSLLTVSIITLATIIMWAMELFPPWLVALIFITVCCLGGVEPSWALQGFTASGTWLVLAGLVIGLAMDNTGLAALIALKIEPIMRGSFAKTLFGFMFLGLVCVFLLPSAMGRVLLLLPIYKALSSQLGYKEGSEQHEHLILGGVFSTYMPAFSVLTANVPNTVLLGQTETLFGHGPSYLEYFIANFPVLGLAKFALIFFLLWFPVRNNIKKDQCNRSIPLNLKKEKSIEKKKLLIFLSAMILLWITEPLHHLSTAWIAILVTIFLFLPSSGILPNKPLEKLNISSMVYVAGIIGLGTVVGNSPLANVLGKEVNLILSHMPSSDGVSYVFLCLLSTISGFLLTLPAAPAVLTPLSTTLSHSLDLPLTAVYLSQIIGLSTIWFPFQAPPLMIAMNIGHISLKKITKYCFLIGVISLFVLWPLEYIWWHIIGFI